MKSYKKVKMHISFIIKKLVLKICLICFEIMTQYFIDKIIIYS